MKSLIKMTLISSAMVFALAGCNENENASTGKLTISTDAQKESYALGSSFATYMKDNLDQNEIQTDLEYLIGGFEETYRGASQLSEDEIKKTLNAFRERVEKESKARFEKEKTDNTAAGEKFRQEFAKQKGVKQTKSGLLYQIIKEGNGRHPTADDSVIVHYVGTLTNGQKFDSSYDHGETATFPLKAVISGWTEGIQLIGVGGKIKLVVPPELAYGDQKRGGQGDKPGIGPASTLVFEVELLGIDGDDSQQSIQPLGHEEKVKPSAEPQQ